MPTDRPAIPRPLDRDVRVEAGHRCAIPTCRATSGLQIHHIVPWAQVRKHEFENLILLCSNCHARVTNQEIDRKAILAYKANLSLVRSRYGDLERRVLQHFVRHQDTNEVVIDTAQLLLLDNLIEDGLLVYQGPATGALWTRRDGQDAPAGPAEYIGPAIWRLTDRGRMAVMRISEATELE